MSTSRVIVEGLIEQFNKNYQNDRPGSSRIDLHRYIDFTGPETRVTITVNGIRDKKLRGRTLKVQLCSPKMLDINLMLETAYARLLESMLQTAIFGEILK